MMRGTRLTALDSGLELFAITDGALEPSFAFLQQTLEVSALAERRLDSTARFLELVAQTLHFGSCQRQGLANALDILIACLTSVLGVLDVLPQFGAGRLLGREPGLEVRFPATEIAGPLLFLLQFAGEGRDLILRLLGQCAAFLFPTRFAFASR